MKQRHVGAKVQRRWSMSHSRPYRGRLRLCYGLPINSFMADLRTDNVCWPGERGYG